MRCALTGYALLRFSGTDAQAFLHNQLTCDVLALQPGMSTYGGYCNPKGRLLATFLLWSDAAGYIMLLPAALAEPIRKRLAMYILRSKVQVADVTTAHAFAFATGENCAEQAIALAGAAPQALHRVSVKNNITALHLPTHRYLLILPADQPVAEDDGAALWQQLDIAAGIPFVTPATQEEFVPQMLNLDLIGGLSYTKGCYPGQEIVARTHYLGRLKQRMYRGTIAVPTKPGDKLYCADLGDQAGGMIVTSACAADGTCEVLAVLQTANAQTAQYHSGSLQGPSLSLAPLPYAVQ